MSGGALARVGLTVAAMIILGVAAGLGMGAQALIATVGAGALALAGRTQWLAIACYMAVTSVFGSFTIVGLGSLPDLTVTRLASVWLAILILGKWHVSSSDLTPEGRRFHSTVNVLGLTVLALGLLAALRNSSVTTGLQLYVDQILIPFGLLLIASRMRVTKETTRRVIQSLVFLGVVWSILGLYEFVSGRSLFAAGGVLLWARESYARVGGPFINPAGLGTAIGIAIVAAVGAANLGMLKRPYSTLALAACFIGIGTTLTRGSWLSVILGLLILGLLLGMRGLAAWAGAGLGASVVAYTLLQFVGESAIVQRVTGEGPVFNRIIVYAAALQVILDNALAGVGLGMFASVVLDYMGPVGNVGASFGIGVFAPHNSLLHAAAEAGLLTTGLALTLWLVVARQLGDRRVDGSQVVRVVGLPILVVYFTNAMFIDMWLTQNLNPLFYVLVGVLTSGAVHDKKDFPVVEESSSEIVGVAG